MNFETKDSFSPEKQLTSLNRADLERKREIVIQKRKDLEKKLLTTIDDLLAQKLGEENSSSSSGKKKEQSIYEKNIQMKRNEIELKKKKLASYQEKRNKENNDIYNSSNFNNDNYNQVLFSLKQKYPLNEKIGSPQNLQNLRQKYAYLLQENQKKPENQEEKKSDLFSNYKEQNVQKTAQTVINLQQFKKDLIPKKVQLSNGRIVNENLAKTIALLEGNNFEIDSDRAKNESKIRNEGNLIKIDEQTENIQNAGILKKNEPKKKIQPQGKTILLATGQRVNENIAKTIALLENSLGQNESNENSKNPQNQAISKQENDQHPEKIKNEEPKVFLEEKKHNEKIEQNPDSKKESHFSKKIKTTSGKVIHVSLAKRVALLEMAMKSGNADPRNENFSPEKINENTLKSETNPKMFLPPIKVPKENNNNFQNSPANSVNSTPVGTPKKVVIGKSGKPIAKTIFKRVMMLEKLFGSDGGSTESPEKNHIKELQHANLERPSIPPIRKKTPRKDDNFFN